MFVVYSILIFIIGLSYTEGIYRNIQTAKHDLSESLNMDEAYLIVKNMNCSNTIILSGNPIVCEYCDLEPIITVPSNQNITQIISTKYAYDLEVQLLSYNISSLCTFKSYKFAEHGTYVLDVKQLTPTRGSCTINQIGSPSAYMTPAIVGILFVFFYVILIEITHRLYNSGYFDRFRPSNIHQKLINEDTDIMKTSRGDQPQRTVYGSDAETIAATSHATSLPIGDLKDPSERRNGTNRVLPKRLRGLDVFRGFSLMVMIFVNYGGGGYVFFDHSIWNGLTLADLVFPWFTWMMGVSIVLSQRSMRKKNVSKRSILWRICRRTIILLVLGFIGHSQLIRWNNVRLPGVLRRLGICYFFTAIIVLAFDKKSDDQDPTRLTSRDSIQQLLRMELYSSVFQYWLEWICALLSVIVWLLITFLLHVPGCPTGYIGPGGRHEQGKYENCTGGAAGYVDRVVLGPSHIYQLPTCQEIYDTKIPYDPEGILGHLTGIFLCYLGVQAAHIFVHCGNVRRTCIHWIIWGSICGILALILSKGGQSDSWIPINKNLWSLTFVLTLASLAFFILTILFLLVDVYQYFRGGPFLWLGMNSIVIYVCHGWFASTFPVQFAVDSTHAKQLAVHLYGAFFWSFVAGFLYYKRIFIAI